MDSYVQRIRHFIVWDNGDDPVEISPHIYMYLYELRHFRLFPALRELTILHRDFVDYPSNDVPSLWLTPSPSLSEVSILGIGADGVAETLIEKISRSSPDVRQISLKGELGFELGPFLGIMVQFSNLRKLKISSCCDDAIISAHDIDSLSRLKKLQDLQLYFEKAQFKSSSGSNYHKRISIEEDTGFDSLENLRLTAPSRTALQVLEHIPAAKSITKVTIRLQGAKNHAVPYVLQNILRLGSNTLRELQITTCHKIDCPGMSDMFYQCLEDFSLRLPRLEVLDIKLDRVDEELLTALAKSGLSRALTTLHLTPDSSRECYNLRASELGIIAELFPNLRSLEIPLFMDMSKYCLEEMQNFVQSAGARKARNWKVHPLRHLAISPLQLQFSATGDTENTAARTRDRLVMMPAVQRNVESAYVYARYLHQVFPYLRHTDLRDWGHKEVNHHWMEDVFSLIARFVKEDE
ncbi:hypothetical protein D9613_007115 [Agrocybe pediades]|uniref:Uncharacterized protein n=1 Tax=Agrocybe pediades TaxID=84607 RepID=A0A8H4QI05_9AGAR|nr:hypothetical protein D9613_007115 [Agrocybe pediades]